MVGVDDVDCPAIRTTHIIHTNQKLEEELALRINYLSFVQTNDNVHGSAHLPERIE